MTADCVVDTNILVRFLTQDDTELSARATAFFLDVASGSISVLLPDAIVFETVFTLERPYKVARAEIAEGLLGVLQLKNVDCSSRDTFRDVFALYVAHRALSFVDCYLAVLASTEGIDCVATFDTKLANHLGIRRMTSPDADTQ